MERFIKCLLCGSKTNLFYETENKEYYQCNNCFSIMLDPSYYLNDEEEKERYEAHNNDIYDPGYQSFVLPIVQGVKNNYNVNHIGLDYGAGTGPVITKLLEEEGFNIELYDPFFHNYPNKLYKKYDYIICCEVMEHFHNPYDEFNNLSKILKKGGSIFCMTNLYDNSINFDSWYYKNDKTHVFFYHKKSLEWIKNEFGFLDIKIDNNFIKFTNKN